MVWGRDQVSFFSDHISLLSLYIWWASWWLSIYFLTLIAAMLLVAHIVCARPACNTEEILSLDLSQRSLWKEGSHNPPNSPAWKSYGQRA